jgi:23S rRNA pseudouridine2605 synthase
MSDQINRNPRFKKNNSSNNTFRKRQNAKKESNDGLTRLNKHVANSGICSRREADKFIEAGLVSVNGKVITSMGYKVNKTDIVKFNNSKIRREKEQYVLLNKPKNYVTNTKDPRKLNSVLRLVERICKEQLLPVGN